MEQSLPYNPNLHIDYSGKDLEEIYFAGGNFWHTQLLFSRIGGVADTAAGYASGELGTDADGLEAVKVCFDPGIVGVEELIGVFAAAKLNQKDFQKSIFCTGDVMFDKVKGCLGTEGIVVMKIRGFSVAEVHHQNYFEKNPHENHNLDFSIIPKYRAYKKPSIEDIKSRLTDKQFDITQNDVQEKPFEGQYCNFFETGLYVDIINGQPLFSSLDKIDVNSGYATFVKPINPSAVWEDIDVSKGELCLEVRSSTANTRLGVAYYDGPVDWGGMRYDIFSSSIRFVPLAQLEEEGYGLYKGLFAFPGGKYACNMTRGITVNF